VTETHCGDGDYDVTVVSPTSREPFQCLGAHDFRDGTDQGCEMHAYGSYWREFRPRWEHHIKAYVRKVAQGKERLG